MWQLLIGPAEVRKNDPDEVSGLEAIRGEDKVSEPRLRRGIQATKPSQQQPSILLNNRLSSGELCTYGTTEESRTSGGMAKRARAKKRDRKCVHQPDEEQRSPKAQADRAESAARYSGQEIRASPAATVEQ